MGVDPVTHEPLHKQLLSEEAEAPSSDASHSQESGNRCAAENDSIINSEANSSSSRPPENCSSDDSLLLDNICKNESLGKSMWIDEAALVDESWENICHVGLPSVEENSCAWLLDCQDFGIHDFGLDCFSDIEFNVLNTLEMGENIN